MVQSRGYGADRDCEGLGDLYIAVLKNMRVVDHLLQIMRERPHRPGDLAGKRLHRAGFDGSGLGPEPSGLRICHVDERITDEQRGRPALFGPEVVDVDVSHDSVQPRSGYYCRWRGAQTDIRLEHRLLDQILRGRARSRQAVPIPAEVIEMWHHLAGELLTDMFAIRHRQHLRLTAPGRRSAPLTLTILTHSCRSSRVSTSTTRIGGTGHVRSRGGLHFHVGAFQGAVPGPVIS